MSRSTSKRVVVTGASGMVGSYIVADLLSLGYENIVVPLRSEESEIRFKNRMRYLNADISSVKICNVELSNPHEVNELLEEGDILFHCAAQVSLGSGNGHELIENNTRITSVLADCAIKQNIQVMVHMSSIATLESQKYPQPTDESSFARNINNWGPYAKSKFYSENQIWRAIRSGLNGVILNPSVIIGDGDWNSSSSIASLLNMLSHKFPFYTEGASGYVDVRDVARAAILLAENPKSYGQRYLVSAHNLTHHELMSRLANTLGVKPPYIKCSRRFLYVISTLEMILSAILFRKREFSRAMVRSITSRSAYNSNLLKNTTGFEYRSLDETLNYIVDKYRSHTT